MSDQLSHLSFNGMTKDGPNGDCYGWVRAGQCKNSGHADTVAYLGLALDLIYNHNVAVNDDGTVRRIVPGLADSPILVDSD